MAAHASVLGGGSYHGWSNSKTMGSNRSVEAVTWP